MNFVRNISTVNINAITVCSKKELLRDFVVQNDVDIVLLQEVAFDDFCFIPSHHAIVNRSDANVGTAILIRKTIPFEQIIMCPTGRLISVVIGGLNVINVYGHSGSQHSAERDDLFQNTIAPHLNKGQQILIGGDFNCILDAVDCRGKYKPFSKGLRNLINLFQLEDLGLKNRDYTFLRLNSASRLDRFYGGKDFVRQVKKYVTMPVPFSDHHAVVLKFEVSSQNIPPAMGRGYWKINASLLADDETSEEFAQVFASLKQRRKHAVSFSEWWSYDFKNKVKSFYKSKAFEFNRAHAIKKGSCYSQLNDLMRQQSDGLDVQEKMSSVKSVLVGLEEQRLASLRNKVQPSTMLESEKLSIYQVSRVMKRGFITPQLTIETPEGYTTKQAVHDHFEKQFSKPQEQQRSAYSALNHINKLLPQNMGNNLMSPIGEQELLATIKSATRKKAPGPDGLTYEFYERHFELLKQDLLKLFNGFLDGSITIQENFSNGIIVLIFKSGNRNDLQNYRPISLLNTDYKILAKLCARRLKACMELLIGEGQTAGLEGKSCTQNLDKLRTVVARGQQSKRMQFALLSLDLQKAFDSVDHTRLWETLAKYQLPGQFIEFVRKLYGNASSQVLVNGALTTSFRIFRSVRQGCPLSMLLFSLYVEPLIRQLYDSTMGLMIEGRFYKIMAYADDLTLIVRNNEEFDLVMSIVTDFAIQAAIQINFQKSGFLRFNNCSLGPQMIQEKQEFKILGIIIRDNYRDMIRSNFD